MAARSSGARATVGASSRAAAIRSAKLAVAPRPEAFDRVEAELGGERARRRQRFRPADRQRRRGVGEKIFELGERIGGVERQQRRPRLEAGERQHDASGDLSICAATRSPGSTPHVDERAAPPARRGRTARRRSATGRRARRSPACRGAARARATGRRDWRTSGRVSALALTNSAAAGADGRRPGEARPLAGAAARV